MISFDTFLGLWEFFLYLDFAVTSHRINTRLCVLLLGRVQLVATPWTLPRLLCPRDSLGKNTGVGCHFLLQGIFPIQGLNPGLLHCRQMLYHLSY